MSTNWAKPLPIDRANNPLQAFPAACSAIGVTARDAGAATSSVTNLTENTTIIEVTAAGSTGFIKWTTAALTASVISDATLGPNYDNVIPANSYRRFVVPRLIQSRDQVSSVTGLNLSEGLFNAVATKTAGVGSILIGQY